MSKKEIKKTTNFRKVLIFLLVSSPVLLIFILGYPIVSNSNSGVTERCFAIGNLASYLSCLLTSGQALRGFGLSETVISRLNSVLFPFGYLFSIALIGILIGILMTISDDRES